MQIKQLPFQASILATAIALTACGGDSDNGGSSNPGLTGGAADAFTISASGGASASSEGGSGGYVNVRKRNSETSLIINRAGAAAAVFVAPQTTVQLGSVAATISENTTVENITELPSGAVAGLLYTVPGNNRLYKYDGSEEIATRAQEVTGLEVAAGATLTLETNSGSTVRLYFVNDINNNGAIETAIAATEADSNASRANLALYPSAYHGSCAINTSGVYTGSEGDVSNAQDAGDIEISAATIENSGTFTANGADYAGENNGDAGDAGRIELTAGVFISNTGDISATSGSTPEGEFGYVEDITIQAPRINNAGTINANQGSGTENSDSDQAEIQLNATTELINSGDISATGGNIIIKDEVDNSGESAGYGGSIFLTVTAGAEGYGGYGGLVEQEIRQLINSGDLTVKGGDNAAVYGDGGYGGQIFIGASDSDNDGNPYGSSNFSACNQSDCYDFESGGSETIVSISGNLIADGGASTAAYDADDSTQGGEGGYGGNISVRHYGVPGSLFPTRLSGYGAIKVDGGNGVGSGAGGDVNIYTDTGEDESTLPTSAIEVTTNVTANAGTSAAPADGQREDTNQESTGAIAGSLDIYIDADRPYLQQGLLNATFIGDFSANNSDSINADTTYRGDGDDHYLFISAPDNVTVVGNLSLNGGSDTEDAAVEDDNSNNVGSSGGYASLISQYGSISFKGDVSANGGNGVIRGGDAGSMGATAKLANNIAGTMSFNGGNAFASEDDNDETVGGDGGGLMALSGSFVAKSAAVVSATGGTGDTAGYEGGVFVNADCVQGICNNDD